MIYWYFNVNPCSITGLKSSLGDILQRFYRIYHTIVAGENFYHFVNGDTASCLKWHKEISYHFGSHGEISYYLWSHGEIYFLLGWSREISYRFGWHWDIFHIEIFFTLRYFSLLCRAIGDRVILQFSTLARRDFLLLFYLPCGARDFLPLWVVLPDYLPLWAAYIRRVIPRSSTASTSYRLLLLRARLTAW